MASPEIQKASVGIPLRIKFIDEDGDAINLAGASTKRIYLEKPDGTDLTKTGSFTTTPAGDGSDGYLDYVFQSGDLDTTGQWRAQGYVVKGAATHITKRGSFVVKGNIFS